MNTVTVELTAQQVSLLVQIMHEQVSQFQVEPEEQDIAEELLDILEDAENFICDAMSRTSD